MRRTILTIGGVIVVGLLFAVASADPKPSSQLASNARVQELLRERLSIYKEAFETTLALNRAGTTSFQQLMQSHSSLLRAELDLCDTKVTRIAVLEQLVKVAAQAAEAQENLEKAAGAAHVETLDAKARLIEAQIELENEKASS